MFYNAVGKQGRGIGLITSKPLAGGLGREDPADGRGGAALAVADFGATGDGTTDDAPAVRKALAAALEAGPGASVVFEPKSYRLGDNPVAWHCFPLIGHRDLVIEGNGATLVCPEGNLAFHFEGGRNITVRNLTIDTIRPTFTQGEVIAVGADGSLDVKVMDGYPEPPDDAFLAANGHAAHGGGGRHMIVFEHGGVVLTGDRGPTYSLSYYNLLLHRQVRDGAGNRWEGMENLAGRPAGNDAPYEAFSGAAPLMKIIDGLHHEVELSPPERDLIRLWLDSATPYAGTYAAYGTGQIGGWWRNNEPVREMADDWPSTAPTRDAMQRRCSVCHENRMPRFDMPGFQPRHEYLREMKRYGVLTADYDLSHPAPVDSYALDEAYWRQFHHRPTPPAGR